MSNLNTDSEPCVHSVEQELTLAAKIEAAAKALRLAGNLLGCLCRHLCIDTSRCQF